MINAKARIDRWANASLRLLIKAVPPRNAEDADDLATMSYLIALKMEKNREVAMSVLDSRAAAESDPDQN